MDDIVQECDLPFTWKKLALEKEEERPDDIELVQAWVVDMPDQTHVAPMLRWLKQSGLDTDALSHLKRVRRRGPLLTLLLDTSPAPPPLPASPPRLEPAYQLPVPCHPARTPTSLALKNTYWPTAYCPKRKWEPEPWTRAQVRWAHDAVRQLVRLGQTATTTPEWPIVAYVPVPYSDDRQLERPFFGRDTRVSTRHPLRHAALDVIRQIGTHRAARQAQPRPSTTSEKGNAIERGNKGNRTVDGDDHTRGRRDDGDDDDDGSGGGDGGGDRNSNGARYLLTGLSLFITHEPCLMCTMALLHSRVKQVFYLVPMPHTGGCGGVSCIPSLKGVNHRFSIAVWKQDQGEGDGSWPTLLNPGIDA